MKKAWLHEYVYDFSVNYNTTPVDDVIDIHKCNAIECVSMTNQCSLVWCSLAHYSFFVCRVKMVIININFNESVFHPYRVTLSKCSGSFNNINNLDAKLCLPDVFKNMNIKVFNIMSGGN